MNFLTKKMMSIVKRISLSKFCFMFTLRQGTIMISSVEVSVSSFALILLLLCLTHANRLVDMVTFDMQKFENSIWFHKSDNGTPTYIISNEKKMLIGQHLALILMAVVLLLLFTVTVHFISSALLLYGAIHRSPSHLLPWTSMTFIGLVTGLFGFLPFCYFIFDKYWVVACIILFILYPMHIYAWLTVFNYYRQLTYKDFNKTNNSQTIDKLSLQVIGTHNYSSAH